MQALCAFAHALEVSVRENQRIRWRIVHGENKGEYATEFCIPLVYLWYKGDFLSITGS
jgi:hypothetical protein